LEANEKYAVDPEFLNTTHGELGCVACHGGNNELDISSAHAGLVKDPSADPEGLCNDCHGDIMETFKDSLHYTVSGQAHGLARLGGLTELAASTELQGVFDRSCSSCHATCGQCHVSRPNAVQGGLFAGHMFAEKPPMEDTCYNCHGARNAGEFMGRVGLKSDAHFEMGMDCVSCHDVSNFHGTGDDPVEMFDMAELPECTDCHSDVIEGKGDILQHKVHPEDALACQVCHAAPSNNCEGCHVSVNPETGKISSHSESFLSFKIGLNPDRNELRPWKYIVVRHVPTVENMLEAVGPDLLKGYDTVPNWKMTPTHNIQRQTPQNASCDSCHGEVKWFLQEEDLRPGDSEASKDLVVPWSELPRR